MRISDWSSDVCSSDLEVVAHRGLEHRLGAAVGKARRMAAVGAHRHRGEAQEAEQDPEQTHGRQSRRVASERSEEHTSELQSLIRISYAVFCLKKKKSLQDHDKTSKESQTSQRPHKCTT